MTIFGVTDKSELEAAIAEFDSYALDVRSRYEAILRSAHKDEELNRLAMDEREKVQDYERVVHNIDRLVRQRLRTAMIQKEPSESNVVVENRPAAVRVQRSRSLDGFNIESPNNDEAKTYTQSPSKK